MKKEIVFIIGPRRSGRDSITLKLSDSPKVILFSDQNFRVFNKNQHTADSAHNDFKTIFFEDVLRSALRCRNFDVVCEIPPAYIRLIFVAVAIVNQMKADARIVFVDASDDELKTRYVNALKDVGQNPDLTIQNAESYLQEVRQFRQLVVEIRADVRLAHVPTMDVDTTGTNTLDTVSAIKKWLNNFHVSQGV